MGGSVLDSSHSCATSSPGVPVEEKLTLTWLTRLYISVGNEAGAHWTSPHTLSALTPTYRLAVARASLTLTRNE